MKKPGSFLLVLTVLVGFTETEVVTKQEEKKAPGCMDRWGSLSKEGAEYYDVCFGAGVCTNGEHPLRTEFGTKAIRRLGKLSQSRRRPLLRVSIA